MEHPLTVALLLVPGFNLGLLLIRLFGPPEADALPERAYVHDPITMLLHPPSSHVSPPLLETSPVGNAPPRAVMPQFPVTSHPRSSGFGSDVDRTRSVAERRPPE